MHSLLSSLPAPACLVSSERLGTCLLSSDRCLSLRLLTDAAVSTPISALHCDTVILSLVSRSQCEMRSELHLNRCSVLSEKGADRAMRGRGCKRFRRRRWRLFCGWWCVHRYRPWARRKMVTATLGHVELIKTTLLTSIKTRSLGTICPFYQPILVAAFPSLEDACRSSALITYV